MHYNLENKIKERFNELSEHKMFPAEIAPNDFQLLEVLDFLKPLKGKSILDVGCAKGRFVKTLQERGANVAGIDPTEKFIEVAQKNVKNALFKIGSATDIPFPDRTFDGVLCLEVIEHIPDTELAIREMIRVLKPRGKIIIIDKNILSLHPKYLLPSAIIKKIGELSNKWMYPRGFPFTEEWFFPWTVSNILRLYCQSTVTKFLIGRHNKWTGLLRTFPFLIYDIAWEGIKKSKDGSG